MEARRTEQKKIVADEMKAKLQKKEMRQGEIDSHLSEIDKALGLDNNDDDLFIDGFQNNDHVNPFGGYGGNHEDEALAAAIAASLKDMNQPDTSNDEKPIK